MCATCYLFTQEFVMLSLSDDTEASEQQPRKRQRVTRAHASAEGRASARDTAKQKAAKKLETMWVLEQSLSVL